MITLAGNIEMGCNGTPIAIEFYNTMLEADRQYKAHIRKIEAFLHSRGCVYSQIWNGFFQWPNCITICQDIKPDDLIGIWDCHGGNEAWIFRIKEATRNRWNPGIQYKCRLESVNEIKLPDMVELNEAHDDFAFSIPVA